MIEVLLPNYVAKIGDMKSILQIKFLFLDKSESPKLKAKKALIFLLLALFRLFSRIRKQFQPIRNNIDQK